MLKHWATCEPEGSAPPVMDSLMHSGFLAATTSRTNPACCTQSHFNTLMVYHVDVNKRDDVNKQDDTIGRKYSASCAPAASSAGAAGPQCPSSHSPRTHAQCQPMPARLQSQQHFACSSLMHASATLLTQHKRRARAARDTLKLAKKLFEMTLSAINA